ncbi:DUF3048 domain-containing protein [Kitasatospora sp. NPDC048365]|uniref:DUF3048 domain-containing protein n=1 Tax=Kitasatospora sp. NPDC048365 TaxID=3364050 RepID=UPI003712A535
MNIRSTAHASAARRRTPHRIALPLAAAIALATVLGCAGAPPEPPAQPSAPSGNPLDNVDTAGNVLAVKIDNVGAHVQALHQGLAQADIVYWIEVEGGQSRFLAVYDANHLPALIGPVRSARETDIPLLQQYGRVDFAYSGAISGLLPLLARADLQNITPATDPGVFTNNGVDPTFVDPHRILAEHPSVPARSPGFVFGPAPDGGSPLAAMTWRLPAASIGAHYNGSTYDVTVDGRHGWTGTATVVVQHVSIVPGAFTDFNAGHPDNEVFTRTVGSGDAQVLRDGKVWNTHWNRPDPAEGTAFTLPDGSAMTFATGPVLVVLVP